MAGETLLFRIFPAAALRHRFQQGTMGIVQWDYYWFILECGEQKKGQHDADDDKEQVITSYRHHLAFTLCKGSHILIRPRR
jgi:hypothetical protein